ANCCESLVTPFTDETTRISSPEPAWKNVKGSGLSVVPQMTLTPSVVNDVDDAHVTPPATTWPFSSSERVTVSPASAMAPPVALNEIQIGPEPVFVETPAVNVLAGEPGSFKKLIVAMGPAQARDESITPEIPKLVKNLFRQADVHMSVAFPLFRRQTL